VVCREDVCTVLLINYSDHMQVIRGSTCVRAHKYTKVTSALEPLVSFLAEQSLTLALSLSWLFILSFQLPVSKLSSRKWPLFLDQVKREWDREWDEERRSGAVMDVALFLQGLSQALFPVLPKVSLPPVFFSQGSFRWD